MKFLVLEKSKEVYEKEFEVFLNREKHLGTMIRSRVKKFGNDKIAVRHKPYGEWIAYTWGEFGEMIDDTAKAMLKLNVKESEMVGIFAHNRVEWAVADYACYSIRATSVPVYGTNTAKELEYIVDHAELRILFVGDHEQYNKAMEILPNSKTLEKIVVFDKRIELDKSNDKVIGFEAFMNMGKKSGKEKDLQQRVKNAQSDDLSTVIYTSGTTGEPKGVMLTHKNWLAMLFGTGYALKIEETDVNLAFLPLSHVFERAWSYYILCSNAQVDYCHDTKAIADFLLESRPHFMCSVPRVWEKIHAKIKDGLNDASPVKKKLFDWAIDVGGQVQYLKKDGKAVPGGLAFKHKIADKLVLKKIQDVFGGRTKVYNCGGSAFSGEISEFFYKAGVFLLQGYGMTECFVICVSTPERNKFGTCGPTVPLVDVRISPEGEIQAKGPNMMQGYYKRPDLTAEMFTEDGYIKTGDKGVIDKDGFITITDRIKDMFKTAGGKYIAPQQIETILKEDYYFEHVATIGDEKPYVTALIVPAFEQLEAYAKKHNISYKSKEDLIKNPAIIKFYQDRINHQTRDLGQVSKVKKFTLLPNEFTQEGGEITPTSKLKRKNISQKYAEQIEAMYKDA